MIRSDFLSSPEGATKAEIVAATGWLSHTVRGSISGALKKNLGLTITSEMVDVGDGFAPSAERQTSRRALKKTEFSHFIRCALDRVDQGNRSAADPDREWQALGRRDGRRRVARDAGLQTFSRFDMQAGIFGTLIGPKKVAYWFRHFLW